jgi:CDGSH-type Zn-finger protein
MCVLVRVDPAGDAAFVLCHCGHGHPFVVVVDGTHSRSRTGQ